MDDSGILTGLCLEGGADLIGFTKTKNLTALVLGFNGKSHRDLKLLEMKTSIIAQKISEKGFRAEVIGGIDNIISLRDLAVNSGLGFIGKSGLLITRQYGPNVRLTAILTDALLENKEPIMVKNQICDECELCLNACPTGSIQSGDHEICISASVEKPNKNSCSLCIEVCPAGEL